MKKLPDCITDEDRKNIVDHNYARFKADKLKTIFLININIAPNIAPNIDPNIDPKIDPNIDPITGTLSFVIPSTKIHSNGYSLCVCTNCGIEKNRDYFDFGTNAKTYFYYYKTLEAAYGIFHYPVNYTGKLTKWHINGKKSGILKIWYGDGRKDYDGMSIYNNDEDYKNYIDSYEDNNR